MADFPGFVIREILAVAPLVDDFQFFDVTTSERHGGIVVGVEKAVQTGACASFGREEAPCDAGAAAICSRSMSPGDSRFFTGPMRWFHTDPARSNQYCPYCGAFVGAGSVIPSDKEHLIGRRFVPTGSLDEGAFNFIFRSCKECNHRKGRAERHVSSITLFTSPGRAEDSRIDAIARRKASRDYHPDKKGVLVEDAGERPSVKFRAGPMSVRVEFVSAPQLNQFEAQTLACYHVMALFALVTTKNCRVKEACRILPPPQLLHFGYFGHGDWGNPHLAEISQRVQAWPCYANVATANGYFRAIMRRGEKWWFWALEWNRSVRVVGAIAGEDEMPDIFQNLPPLKWVAFPTGRIREERPLGDAPDTLFESDFPDDSVPIPRVL